MILSESNSYSDTPASIHSLIANFKNAGFDLSKAVDELYDIDLRGKETLPCIPITTVSDLATFLKGKCQYRYYREDGCGGFEYSSIPFDGSTDKAFVSQDPISYTFATNNINNYYSTDEAVFLIVHPPSEARTSNGHNSFVSLAHHNFTAYSDVHGPVLVTPCPRNTLKIKQGRLTIPFVPITEVDNQYVFLDRSGLGDVTLIETDNDQVGFIDDLSPNPHELNITETNVKRIYVPLNKDEKTIASGWQVYALPNDPQISDLSFAGLLQPSLPDKSEDGSVHPMYIDLKFGNPLVDNHFDKIWIISGLAIAALITAYGFNHLPKDAQTIKNILTLGKYLAVGLAVGGLTWPIATFIWALREDSKYYR